MKKELNLANVLISLIMLTVGVILVINSEAMINMMSWFIGIVIILISIIRIIYFILAIAVSRVDKQSYKTFLISALIMLALGVLVLINLYNLVGIFLIIYSLTEIVNYIYYLINKNKYGNLFDKEEYDNDNKRVKKKQLITKEIKNKKAIDADIVE